MFELKITGRDGFVQTFSECESGAQGFVSQVFINPKSSLPHKWTPVLFGCNNDVYLNRNAMTAIVIKNLSEGVHAYLEPVEDPAWDGVERRHEVGKP